MSRREKREMRKKQRIDFIKLMTLIILIIILAVIATCLATGKFKVNKNSETNNEEQNISLELNKQMKIYNGKDRPIAVMIDNSEEALPQAGINDAYIVYEIGADRLLAIFKNVNLDKIGPIRSAKQCFLDYVLENDAILTHLGSTTQAQQDIKKFKIDSVNGLKENENSFWKDNTKTAPHNSVTSTENILSIAKTKRYKDTSNKSNILNYTTEEINLDDGSDAINVRIFHNSYNSIEYKYNKETKRYTRYSNGTKQTDCNTNEDITTKNIIITFVENAETSAMKEEKLNNIGTMDGYYITNGKVIKITCTKEDKTSKTVYKDKNGKEIKVNVGNTFIQIVSSNKKVAFE